MITFARDLVSKSKQFEKHSSSTTASVGWHDCVRPVTLELKRIFFLKSNIKKILSYPVLFTSMLRTGGLFLDHGCRYVHALRRHISRRAGSSQALGGKTGTEHGLSGLDGWSHGDTDWVCHQHYDE